MGERMTVRLVGGGPWGFRLQGGSGSPLTVSKIRRKSRAQHHLVEGDRILSINGVPCDSFTYDEAMGVVDAADNTLNIEIIRGGAGGKENRDPSAPTHQPKELPIKEKPISHSATVKTKPMEHVAKTTPKPQESSGPRPQIPKQDETTIQGPTTPATKAAPPPPPPKTLTSSVLQTGLPPPLPVSTSTTSQITSFASEFKSSVRQVSSSSSEFKEVTQERKDIPQSIAISSVPVTKIPEVPPLSSAPGVVSFTSPPEPKSFPSAQVISAPSPRPYVPTNPTSTIQGLSPELEALGPELAALENELAAFKGPEAVQRTDPGQSQRRQEVSLETTSDGQRYHSLTSEKSSWSDGPQHKASAFQQQEETRQVSKTADDPSKHVETFKTENKKEVIRVSKTEFSSSSLTTAQNQVNSGKAVDALTWRPSSPKLGQQKQASDEASKLVAKSPTPPPTFQINKASPKASPVPAVWSPPSASPEPAQQPQDPKKKKKKVPPPTLPKPSKGPQSRPTSAPPRDYDIWDPFSDTELVSKQCSSSRAGGKFSNFSTLTSASSGAVSDTEDWHQAFTSEDEMGSTSILTRKKKMFSSSSFYEEPHCIYPTVEEQVELARKIAGSLSNDNNKKSRGANMFFKRVKRSHTWIHEGPDPYSDGGTTDTDMEPTTPDPTSGHYIKVSSGPPKLKLILDPRQLQDLVKLRNSGLNPVDHSAVSPDICLDLVRDLNSPRGKGAALFAKRKQKAEEWVVDEERVKQQLAQKEAEVAQLQEESRLPFTPGPVGHVPVLVQNRLKLIKSPWEAALESPIGSCDAAFVELPPVVSNVASSIIRAAENKARIAPAAASYNEPLFALQPDIYKPKAPRGWVGPATGSVPSGAEASPSPLPFAHEAPVGETSAPSGGSTMRPYSFHDFNTTPRTWKSAPVRGQSFRHVAPPSFLK